jgi:hypothetical protein
MFQSGWLSDEPHRDRVKGLGKRSRIGQLRLLDGRPTDMR